MENWAELTREKEETDSWVIQYIAWTRQFVPKDAKFNFDSSISASEALRRAEEDFSQETS